METDPEYHQAFKRHVNACHETYLFKISVVYAQHQSFAAVGVDQKGWTVSCSYKAMILSHVELWIKQVCCKNSDQHSSNRVLPGVVVLVRLVDMEVCEWGNIAQPYMSQIMWTLP